jgi:hypothetical protein
VAIARSRVERCLNKFINSINTESLRKAAPVLYEIYITSSSCGGDDNVTPSAIKPEVVEVFKEREEKLIRFSQSIIDITSDLLGAFESGDTLDQSFMTKFKSKFDFFRGALPVVNETQPRYKSSAPPPLLIQKSKEDDKDKTSTPTAAALTSRRHRSTAKKSPIHSGTKTKKRKKMREIDVHSLKFDDIVSDLYSKVHVVENLLIDSLEKCDEKQVCLMQDAGLELENEKKVAYAVTSAMSASSLSCTLAHLIVRRDKDNQSAKKRESVANVLVRHDILGIVKRNRRRASIERMEPDTSDLVQLIATSMRNEGVVGFIESLRNILPHSEHFILQKSSPKHASASVIRENLESDQDVDEMGDRNSAVVLLEASHCLCESLYRLVVALGSTRIGLDYLHSYGSELTSYTTKVLIQLPSDFSMYDKGSNIKSFTDDILENTGGIENGVVQENSTTDSNNGSYTERKNGRTVDINDVNPAISLRLWCILALTVLAAHRSNETIDVNANSEYGIENKNENENGYENKFDNNHDNNCVFNQKEDERDKYKDRDKEKENGNDLKNEKENEIGNNKDIINENENNLENENEKSSIDQIIYKDHIQLLIVEDGALEWLNQAFFSLLMEILSAAFGSNLKVLEEASGTDSISIGMATLSLDARKFTQSKIDISRNGSCDVPSDNHGISFSIFSTVSDLVPQELLVLLELCLGMLVFSVRSPRVQTVMTSTETFQKLSRSLLKTLFRLLLLPQISQPLADGILVTLNILFQDHIKFRLLARDLKDLIVLEKKIILGGLKWFHDTGRLEKLLLLINSNKTKKSGIIDPGSHSNLRILAESNKYDLKCSDVVDVVTSLEDIALGKVIETQTHATDNTQLLEFLSRQKGFTGRINTSILLRYEDPSRNNYQPSAGSSDLGPEEPSHSPSSSRFRSSHENKIISLQNSMNTDIVEAVVHD